MIRIPSDFPRKIGLSFFIISICFMATYQLSFALVNPMAPFLEPDNYIYLLFSNLSIQSHSFNVSNPYLITPRTGFFEHPGLYELPVFLHFTLPFLPLYWDFRLLYLCAILAIYVLTLLMARAILSHTPISPAFRYSAYALIVMSYLLMQQTEVIEWRGNTFILACQIGMLYLIALLFIHSEWTVWKKVLVLGGLIALLCLSWYMWSGWLVNLFPLTLAPIFIVYDRIKGRRFWWIVSVTLLFTGICVGAFPVLIEHLIMGALQPILFYLHFSFGCSTNVLGIGELECLTPTNGLYTVALDLFFSAIMVWTFLAHPVIGNGRRHYEYFIIGIVALMCIQLPLALVYLRLVQLIAPYLTLGFALGTVVFLSRSSGNKTVIAATMLILLISSWIGFFLFWQSTYALYTIDNPFALAQTTSYLNQYHNATVLAPWNYGDYLEAYGHAKVYGDTIQELNYTSDTTISTFYLSDSCMIPEKPKPEFILASSSFSQIGVFANALNSSFAKDPLALLECNYTIAYQTGNYYLFRT